MTRSHTGKALTAFNLSVILPQTKVEKVKMIFRAINHDLRKQILSGIESKQLYVEQIENFIGKEQSVTSQHLAILREQEVVVDERRGKFIYYSINFEQYNKIISFAKKLFPKEDVKQTEDKYLIYAIRKTILLIRALNHNLRKRMLDAIGKDSLIVTDVYLLCRLEQSVASQHLAILRRAGVVNAERNGQNVEYSIDFNRLNYIIELIDDLLS